MYSVVLMMALSGAPATPAFGGRGCDGGCRGGYACRGDDCGGRRGLFRRRGGHDCGGGWGGCNGGRRGHGCCGYNGGCAGYGGGCAGYGGHGGCAWGGAGCAMSHGCAATTTAEPVKVEPKKEKGKEEARIAAPATIVVSMPADAKLKIDDYVTTSTSSTRVFTSPALQPGQEYTYTLTAIATRDGREVSTTKDVAVQAGRETRVTLDFAVTVASR